MKIAVLDDYQDAVKSLSSFEKLKGHEVTVWTRHVQDDGELAEGLAETEALVLIRERTRIGAALLERLPRLRLISQRGSYPHLDIAACTRLGIVVSSNLHGAGPSYSTVELTLGLIIAGMRRLPRQIAALKAGRWQGELGYGLRGKRLGIYGYGKIGGEVARLGKAFGMRVMVLAREQSQARAERDGFAAAASREDFFSTCDVISLHLRLTDATRGSVTAADLSRMQRESLLVNTSRAALIAPGALAEALKAGRPGMAAVDVFEDEPVTGSHPLLALDNCICTPHVGYVTRDEYEAHFSDIFDQIVAYANGMPINVVNPEALNSPARR